MASWEHRTFKLKLSPIETHLLHQTIRRFPQRQHLTNITIFVDPDTPTLHSLTSLVQLWSKVELLRDEYLLPNNLP